MVLVPVSDAEMAEAREYVRRHGTQYKSGFGGVCAMCRKPVAAGSVEVVAVDRESREVVESLPWNDPRNDSREYVIVGRDCKKSVRS